MKNYHILSFREYHAVHEVHFVRRTIDDGNLNLTRKEHEVHVHVRAVQKLAADILEGVEDKNDIVHVHAHMNMHLHEMHFVCVRA